MARNRNTGQARFTRRLTSEQRDAILRSVLVDGRTVADTIRMANAGTLGLPAFQIGVYAYDLIRKHRDSFEERDEDALARAVANELKGAELDALAALRKARREIKAGAAKPDALRIAAQTLSAVQKARRDANTNKTAGLKPRAKAKASPVSNQPDDTNTSNSADTITSLLAKAPSNTREGARTASITRAPSDDPPTIAA